MRFCKAIFPTFVWIEHGQVNGEFQQHFFQLKRNASRISLFFGANIFHYHYNKNFTVNVSRKCRKLSSATLFRYFIMRVYVSLKTLKLKRRELNACSSPLIQIRLITT
uniref:Mariner Mos1 transposase n=1 Tax=Schistocephalus solidus TaxID=70667 RepID=A0A0X3NQD8_SCHSO